MRAKDVQEVFETILPDEALMEVVRAAGLQQRERKLDALRLLRAAIIAAASGHGGRQADILRAYLHGSINEAKKVVRGGFYAWFGKPLETVMSEVVARALAFARSRKRDLPGFLADTADDWLIADSTTVQLDKKLKKEYPGAGDYAALKIHKLYSVGVGTTVDYHLSPAKEHDAKHLTIDESWEGLGLLIDLAYASLKLIADCEWHGAHYVLRLKSNWKPRVQKIRRGEVSKTFVKGTDLDLLLEQEVIKLDGKVIDAEVRIGGGAHEVAARLVGVPTRKGYCFFLTSLPPTVGPHQVATLYRVRWEIEQDNKLDKSCHRLDEIGAQTGPAARALVHASMTASIIVNLLAHAHRLEEGSYKRARARTVAPIHPQMLGRMVASACHSIAAIFEMPQKEAQAAWQRMANAFFLMGQDPNWRRRPSVLDELRGFRRHPKPSRKPKSPANLGA